MRTLPVTGAPPAGVTCTAWPGLIRTSSADGHLGAPLEAPLADQAEHLLARLARTAPTVARARRDHAVVGRQDLRLRQAHFVCT